MCYHQGIVLSEPELSMKGAHVTRVTTATFPFPFTVRLIPDLDFTINSVLNTPGSGIALYAMVIFAITFTATIDGGTQTLHHFDGVWNCCNATIQPAYNFTIYDVTTLPLGGHTLLVTVLDSVGNNGGGSFSRFYFDYALVTLVEPTHRYPPLPTGSTTSNSSQSASR